MLGHSATEAINKINKYIYKSHCNYTDENYRFSPTFVCGSLLIVSVQTTIGNYHQHIYKLTLNKQTNKKEKKQRTCCGANEALLPRNQLQVDFPWGRGGQPVETLALAHFLGDVASGCQHPLRAFERALLGDGLERGSGVPTEGGVGQAHAGVGGGGGGGDVGQAAVDAVVHVGRVVQLAVLGVVAVG